jgi:hypothetical protein
VANVSLTDSVQVVIWLEAFSLSFWAGLAAWYAGLRGRSLALSILGGLVVSTIVLVLQVFLQPGKPANNAMAGHHGPPLPHARKPRATTWVVSHEHEWATSSFGTGLFVRPRLNRTPSSEVSAFLADDGPIAGVLPSALSLRS